MNDCPRSSRASRREFLQGLAGAIGCGSAAALIPQFGLVGSALAAAKGTVTGYKALVCVYLDGGNDAFNMLVPYDQARYDIYAAARGGVGTGLALDRNLLATTQIADSATGAQYALHPGIPDVVGPPPIDNPDRGMLDLRTLYQQNRVAFVPNIGTLTRPITKTEYNTNLPGTRPPQLYSHSDQQYQWQFGRAGSSAVGWGGTVGDAVRNQNLNQTLSPCISIAGDNRFEIGLQTFPYQMGSGGLTALNVGGTPSAGSAALLRRNAIDAILAGSNTSPFAGEYQAVMNRAQSVYNILNPALASPEGNITAVAVNPNETLAQQLRMVARMIKVSRDTAFQVQHQRQIYFVRLGGFDLHDGLMAGGPNGHAGLLQRVSEALEFFWRALNEIGAQNQVTTFTMSEFARTLTSNGNGSDHAWGSVAMVMGGTQVLGGRLYGAYPDLALNGPISFTSGQQIPQIGVEQYAATLARWMGVTDPMTLGTIFPNLGQFASSDLGFMAP